MVFSILKKIFGGGRAEKVKDPARGAEATPEEAGASLEEKGSAGRAEKKEKSPEAGSCH